ncbi:MAG: Amuc_1100 family pilus-like protein [Pontiella sp.]
MSFRQHKALMIGSGICAAILVVEATVLAVGMVRLSKANQIMKLEQQRLARLLTRNPYPSVKNVQRVEKNLDELEYHLGALSAEMMRDPFPEAAMEAAEFSARAQDVIERFRKRAKRAGMVLPDSLEVGFAKYASGGAIPQVSDVPRLTRQLYSVERVADVLVKSGVTSVDKLSRDLFEISTAADIPPRRRSRNAPSPVVRKSLLASKSGPNGLFYIERIGVSFTAQENMVWRVLDGFAAAPHFMVVAEFSHRTNSGVLTYNLEAGKGDDEETQHFLSKGILSGRNALSRSERIVFGDELVEVRLTVEVYNFEPGKAAR